MHIGRSNGCDIVISDGSVSRKHATLVYNDGKWNLIDGDGVTPSRNGLWRRVKKIMISCEAQDKTIYSSVAKMGGVMLTIEAKL
jgi:pSer/pThr/pTyr-binding forkhead associated (FHA) protein